MAPRPISSATATTALPTRSGPTWAAITPWSTVPPRACW